VTVDKMEKVYTFKDLVDIIDRLRGEDGCPWDREQTHESLKPCMIEEAYEVVDGIRILDETGLAHNLCEELGDVLLQVVMHSRIAEEEGLFTYREVIQGICEKMIRRHPHVFGQVQADTAETVLLNWEEIKRNEKKDMLKEENPLQEIPHSLPALIRTEKVQKKLDNLYNEGRQMSESLTAAENMLKRIDAGVSAEEAGEAFGELLWHVVNAARKQHIHPEQALISFLEGKITEKT